VQLSDIVPGKSLKISGEGKGGVAGFAKGGAKVSFEPMEGGTRLTYEAEANVGGKIAQLGSRIIDSFAKKLADEFFTRFQDAVEEPGGPGERPKKLLPIRPKQEGLVQASDRRVNRRTLIPRKYPGRNKMTKVFMTVNGKAVSGEVEGQDAAVHLPARGAGADRHPCRLRHQPVRRLRGACRWQAGEKLHGLCAGRGGGQRQDHRGHGERGWLAGGDPAGVPGPSRAAMRLLHAGHGDVLGRPAGREPEAHRGRGAHYLDGNICRCTGYHNIVKAVMAASGQDVSALAAE
jgi:hypothetical protein